MAKKKATLRRKKSLQNTEVKERQSEYNPSEATPNVKIIEEEIDGKIEY